MSLDQQERVSSVLPNFRCLYSEPRAGGHGLLYRSYRPDFLRDKDLEAFSSLGIKSIIDLRSKSDYLSSGDKEIDNYYSLYTVSLPKGGKYKTNETVSVRSVGSNGPANNCPSGTNPQECRRRHYLVNFFTSKFLFEIFRRLPWYLCIWSLFVVLFDVIFMTRFKYFSQFFAANILNVEGLASSYIDMSELSQHSICAALKLMTDKNNIPALINCAYGKDRTGIVSALVLFIMGESEEAIIRDYTRSKEGLLPVRSNMVEELYEKYTLDKSFSYAEPEMFYTLLDHIKTKYGSMNNYLEYIGFTEEDQDMLRRNLGFKGRYPLRKRRS